MANPVYNQEDWQGYDDDGGLGAATAKAAVNTDWVQDVDENFRIRFVIQQTNASKSVNNAIHTLYANYNGGGYAAVTTTSSNVKLVDDGNSIADHATTIQRIGDGSYTTDDSEGWNDGQTDNHTGNIDYPGAVEAEVEFCLQVVGADVADGNYIDFEVRQSDGTQFNTYNTRPHMEVNKTAASITGNISQSFGTIAQSLSGDVQVSGNVAQTFGVLAQSLSGSAPANTSVAQLFKPLSQAAIGIAPASADALQLLPGVNQTLDATAPTSADISQQLTELSQSLVGDVQISGDITQAILPFNQSAGVDVEINGNITQILSTGLKQVASVSSAQAATGNILQVISAISQSANVDIRVNGDIAQQVGELVQTLAGIALVSANVIQQLGDLAQTLAGVVNVNGNIAQQLTVLSQSLGANVEINNDILQQLAGITQTLDATAATNADITQVLDSVTQTLAGITPAGINISQIISELSQSASGVLRVNSDILQTLTQLQQSAGVDVEINGDILQSFDPIVQAAAASSVVTSTGNINQAIGQLVQSADVDIEINSDATQAISSIIQSNNVAVQINSDIAQQFDGLVQNLNSIVRINSNISQQLQQLLQSLTGSGVVSSTGDIVQQLSYVNQLGIGSNYVGGNIEQQLQSLSQSLSGSSIISSTGNINQAFSILSQSLSASTIGAIIKWNGVDTDGNKASNWLLNRVPTGRDLAYFDDTSVVNCIFSSGISCRGLTAVGGDNGYTGDIDCGDNNTFNWGIDGVVCWYGGNFDPGINTIHNIATHGRVDFEEHAAYGGTADVVGKWIFQGGNSTWDAGTINLCEVEVQNGCNLIIYAPAGNYATIGPYGILTNYGTIEQSNYGLGIYHSRFYNYGATICTRLEIQFDGNIGGGIYDNSGGITASIYINMRGSGSVNGITVAPGTYDTPLLKIRSSIYDTDITILSGTYSISGNSEFEQLTDGNIINAKMDGAILQVEGNLIIDQDFSGPTNLMLWDASSTPATIKIKGNIVDEQDGGRISTIGDINLEITGSNSQLLGPIELIGNYWNTLTVQKDGGVATLQGQYNCQDFIGQSGAGYFDSNGQTIAAGSNITWQSGFNLNGGSSLNGCTWSAGGDFSCDGQDLQATDTWYLTVLGSGTAENVIVAYSDARGGNEIVPNIDNCTDADNNYHWAFSLPYNDNIVLYIGGFQRSDCDIWHGTVYIDRQKSISIY